MDSQRVDLLIHHAHSKLGGRLGADRSSSSAVESTTVCLAGKVRLFDGQKIVETDQPLGHALVQPVVREGAIRDACGLLGRSVSVRDVIDAGFTSEPDCYVSGTTRYRGFVAHVRAWIDGYVDVYVRADSDRSTGEWVDVALVRQLERK